MRELGSTIPFVFNNCISVKAAAFHSGYNVQYLYQAPQANAFAERWARSIRQECLDVFKQYIEYYNQACPYQGIDQRFPVSAPQGAQDEQFACATSWEALFTTTIDSLQS